MREDRHIPLLNGLIQRAGDVIAANDHLIKAMVHERASGILRWTGLDENVANAIIGGLNKLFSEMAEDPHHPLREKANALLADVAEDLQHDPAMKARVSDLKSEIVDNPAMKKWIDGLWEQAREALLKAAHDPNRAMAGKFGEILAQLGLTLQEDVRLRQTINRFARRTTVGATARYGDVIVRLISDTVRGWDAEKITSRVENAVGRDLQYIRINGTVVGGLVGLLIHVADIWL